MKKVTIILAVLGVSLCAAAQHTLNNPIGEDGRYIVKYDCDQGQFAAANDMEVDETFTLAVDVTGTWLEDFLNGTPTAEGATRGIAFLKWTHYGDVNGNTARMKQIDGNIWGMTVNYAQTFTDTYVLMNDVLKIDSVLCTEGMIFGFEFTDDNPGAGWWMWENQVIDKTQAPGSDCLFAFLPYTGTKTSPEFYGDDAELGEDIYGMGEKGYAAPCVFASSNTNVYEGACGAELYWVWDKDTKALTITGTGDMDIENYRDWNSVVGIDSIHTISLPDGITGIAAGAFYGDWSKNKYDQVREVIIPSSVTYFGNRSFSGLSNADRIEYLGNTAVANWAMYNGKVRYLKVPAGFGYGIFVTDSLIITNGTIEAGAYSFAPYMDLSSANNMDMSAIMAYYYTPDILRTLLLPAGLETIDADALRNCRYLAAITIPAAVTEIGTSAFEDCRSLGSVTFAGNNLQTIGDWAFYNCHNLRQITLPEGLQEVGTAAFYGCTFLTDLTIPSTAKKITENGFALCAKLQRMYVNALVPPAIEAKTFEDVDRSIPVFVPRGTMNLYKADQYWSEFLNIEEYDAPTGILNTASDSQTSVRKVLKDGQVLILRGEDVYTLLGEKLQ